VEAREIFVETLELAGVAIARIDPPACKCEHTRFVATSRTRVEYTLAAPNTERQRDDLRSFFLNGEMSLREAWQRLQSPTQSVRIDTERGEGAQTKLGVCASGSDPFHDLGSLMLVRDAQTDGRRLEFRQEGVSGVLPERTIESGTQLCGA
jgi:hypothetical protein